MGRFHGRGRSPVRVRPRKLSEESPADYACFPPRPSRPTRSIPCALATMTLAGSRCLPLALRLALAAAVLPVGCDRPAAAQLRGTVADPAGRPLAGVTVEAWSPLRLLRARVTDTEGAFRFAPEEVADAQGILARGAGWRTVHVRVAPGDTLVAIRLDPHAAALEGITVTARRASCPNREDARARALWTALRDRYDGGRDSSTLAAYALHFESVGPKDRIGFVDTASLSPSWFKTSLPHRRLWERRISLHGYALPLRESLVEQYAGWIYPPLESQYATHFVEDLFGDRHTFSVARSTGSETVLRFCPRERSGKVPRIEGTLTLSGDGSPVRVAWKYLTPEPREDAGGEVDFAPASVSPAVPLLLPATALYWRKTTQGRYFQRWEKFEEWRVVDYFAVPDRSSRPD
jgi:hypothetical protein